MIIINLDLLEFNNFFVNKNFHNRVLKIYKWDKLWKDLSSKLNHLKIFHTNKNKLDLHEKDHYCSENTFSILFDTIIHKCHSNLYATLEQMLEPINLSNMTSSFFSIHTTPKSTEVVFCLIINNEIINGNDFTIYPLILDLNHCIDKVAPNKPYAYRHNKNQREWDLNESRDEIKKILLNEK